MCNFVISLNLCIIGSEVLVNDNNSIDLIRQGVFYYQYFFSFNLSFKYTHPDPFVYIPFHNDIKIVRMTPAGFYILGSKIFYQSV